VFLQDAGDHYVAYSGSEAGRKLLNSHVFERGTHEAGKICVDYQEKSHIDVHKVWKNLLADYNNPVWEETGKRCLGCANCTVVCPLCYCYDVLDVSKVTPDEGERVRCWDSCTLVTFARVAGGHNFRKDIKSRYRNIYTHKFRTYVDLFGLPACIGCGRCVTFCPAGIDMRETLRRAGGE
jgi:ferredoxin